MNKHQAIQTLTNSKTLLNQRFGVNRLALFGSTARGTSTANSDIDILVSFDGIATSQRYFGVQFYLEDLLGCSVDLVTEKALRQELRPYIEREAIDV
ncbi:MAG: nucleotidyltransferase family protein [Bdellovibrio sp.]|nr:nucleotidyltransferase family protein [Methylotenera sp.]